MAPVPAGGDRHPVRTVLARSSAASPRWPPGTPPAPWAATSAPRARSWSSLRGSLLRRFPTTTIYLSGQTPGQPDEQVVLPTVTASVGLDTTLVGFPISVEQLTTPPVPGQVWSVVLQESVAHARFGLDDAPADGTTATLTSWQDLDWSHPQVAGHRHVPVGRAARRRHPA